jgi:hypothetical protein
MLRLLYFLIPLPFLAVCFVMIALNSILGDVNAFLGEVNPETLDRYTLVRVMQIRDFSRFSSELQERLMLRAEQEFGRHSPNKPVFAMSSWEKKMHVHFQQNRTKQPSYMESNLTLIAKVRYCQWMREYNSATRTRKAELMSDVVEDMRYWQEVYLDYLRCLGVPEPTLAELYQDFQRMINNFKAGASPEEAKRIEAFAQEISRALFASEVQKSFMNLFVPKKGS